MRICFVHQNMPAQYRHLIAGLLARGDQVLAIGEHRAMQRWPLQHANLGRLAYRLPDMATAATAAVPSHLRVVDAQIARAEAVRVALRQLEDQHLRPDVVVAHPGWGEAMFLRAVLPDTPFLNYCEFYYRAQGADVGFDPEYPADDKHWQRLQLRNMPHLLALHDMSHGWCPTAWQKAQFPPEYQHALTVLHEGVDTDLVHPEAAAQVHLAGHHFRQGDAVVTYVARNLEPYRGFHTFMRCLPLLQRLAPQARVLVVGGDEVSYGVRLPAGDSYRQRLMAELGDRVDWTRVVFTGRLPYAQYLKVLQVSAVHAYLSYPFVLSWSLLEAMASGCCIVGSDTPPVREVIEHGVNGRLVDFFDSEALARQIAEALARPGDVQPLRAAARQTVLERFDLQRVTLPAGLALLDRLASEGAAAGGAASGGAAPRV